jgi:short-subunit dehydrogenase
MSRRSWLVLIAVLSAVALYRDRLGTALKQTYANVRAFDLPIISLVVARLAGMLPIREIAGLDPATVFRGSEVRDQIAVGAALVTGASSGIGAAFAHRLAAQGLDLFLVARREGRLRALATEVNRRHGVTADVLAADLSRPADIERVEARIARGRPVEVLINNAGFGTVGYFREIDLGKQLDMIQVHVVAGVRLIRAVLPGMISRGRGTIINVSSLAAFVPTPGSATYSSTKAYLTVFSEALDKELRGTGVKVQVLVPGFTFTEFYDTPEYRRVDMRAKVRSRLPGALWMTADEVVARSLASLGGRLLCAPGFGNRLMIALSRVGLSPLLSSVLTTRFGEELRGSAQTPRRKGLRNERST